MRVQEEPASDMDVSEARAQREIEQLRQLLRQREQEYAEQVDDLRDRQRNQIDELDRNHNSETSRIRKESHAELAKRKDDFDEQSEKQLDTFQRTLSDERKTAYDRYGKLAAEHARQNELERDSANKRLSDAAAVGKREAELARQDRDDFRSKTKEQHEQDRLALNEYLEKSRQYRERSYDKALSDTVLDAQQHVDRTIRKAGEDSSRQKIDTDLLLKKLAAEDEMKRESLKTSFAAQKNELQDKMEEIQKRSDTGGDQTYATLRARTSDSIDELRNTDRFSNLKKDQEHAKRVAEIEHDAFKRTQLQTGQYRKMADEYKNKYELEKERSATDQGFNERRHQQNLTLSNDALRDSARQSMNELGRKHNEMLEDLQKSQAHALNDVRIETERRTRATRDQADAERLDLQGQRDRAIKEGNLKLRHETSVRNDMQSKMIDELDEQRNRQMDDQKAHYSQTINDLKAETNQELARSARENRARMYTLQQNLMNRTAELENQRRFDLLAADDSKREQNRRIAGTYSRSLQEQKDSFEEVTDELRRENSLQATKTRLDTDHERRMQLMEMQAKHRASAMTAESKLQQTKEEHAAELGKLKSENEKAIREILKRTRQSMDAERQLHKQELDARDLQNKEKLKTQEEAFRDEIEKLRRTNDLAMKKQ